MRLSKLSCAYLEPCSAAAYLKLGQNSLAATGLRSRLPRSEMAKRIEATCGPAKREAEQPSGCFCLGIQGNFYPAPGTQVSRALLPMPLCILARTAPIVGSCGPTAL